jgi:cell division protein FtsL
MLSNSRQSWVDAWENDLTPSPAARRSAARVHGRSSSARYYGREATARVPKPLPEAPRRQPLTEIKVAQVSRRRPWRFSLVAVAFCLVLLAAGYIVPVLVSSSTTDLEAATGRLETKQQALTQAGTDLSAQVSSLSSPERLAEQAVNLGLEPAATVHYLEIDAGAAAAEGDTTVAGR